MERRRKEFPLRGNVHIKDWFPENGLDIGMYEDAKASDMTFSMYLEDYKSHKQDKETPYYGLTPPEVFRKRKQYMDKGEEPPRTVIEELFQEAGVKTFGARSDFFGKLYEVSDIDILIPEVLSNKIYAGLMLESLVNEFTATETVIKTGYNYKKLYINDTEAQRDMGIISPGAEIGETHIGLAEKDVQMKKFGTYLTLSYETLDQQRLNVFGLCLERVGRQIGISETDDMFTTLISGDGNSSTTPGTTVETAASGTIAVADVIAWATGAPSPYKIDKFGGKKALIREYLTTLAGMYQTFSAYGKDIGIGLPKWYEWDRTSITTDYFVGVDSRYAIEHLTNGQVLTETESVIKRQVKGTAITYWSAFTIIDNQAVVIFDETHT